MGAGESSIERPTGERPIGDPPIEERPIDERPIKERPIKERPTKERPMEELPTEERPLPPVSSMPIASQRRRLKSALFVGCCGLAGVAPHLAPAPANLLPAISLALLLGGYSLRTVVLPLLRQAIKNRQTVSV